MNKQKVAVGPGASSLILIAVVLTLSVLTVLTMVSARSDEAMTTRSMGTRQEVYDLFAAGERSAAKLDAVLVSCRKDNPEDAEAYLAQVKDQLPDGMKMKDDLVSWTEKTENRTLECEVRIQDPEEDTRMVWTAHRLTSGVAWEDDGFDDFDEEDGLEDEDAEDEDAEDEEIGEEAEDEAEESADSELEDAEADAEAGEDDFQ